MDVQKANNGTYYGNGRLVENTSVLSTHITLAKHWLDLPCNEKPSPDQVSSKLSLEITFQANP
eukprot:10330584-Ditylum_brightwellii.AAC.1